MCMYASPRLCGAHLEQLLVPLSRWHRRMVFHKVIDKVIRRQLPLVRRLFERNSCEYLVSTALLLL